MGSVFETKGGFVHFLSPFLRRYRTNTLSDNFVIRQRRHLNLLFLLYTDHRLDSRRPSGFAVVFQLLLIGCLRFIGHFKNCFENIYFLKNQSLNTTFILRPVCFAVECRFSLQACSQNICLSVCSSALNKSAPIGRTFIKFII